MTELARSPFNTATALVDDPYDARLARGATGVLAAFNAAGVLEPADVHVAARIARLGGETADDVVLALALAVRGVRLGSVCVDLCAVRGTVLGAGDEPVDVSGLPWPDPATWVAACAASPLVADGPEAPDGRPLRLVDGLLYLERYWRQDKPNDDRLEGTSTYSNFRRFQVKIGEQIKVPQ